MRRLLFVPNPHIRLDRPWAAPYVPLELLSAMAVVEQHGAEAALFDPNRLIEFGSLHVSQGIWTRAAALLGEAEPDCVIFETWTGTLHNTLQLARAVRAAHSELPLVLVGAGTSALALEALEAFCCVDAVIRGELEPAMPALAHSSGRWLPAAPGLVRRTAAGTVDAPLASVEDLETLPEPAYHLALLRPGDTIPVEPGRGCGQGCSFCALAGHWAPQYRSRSAEALARQMIELSERFPGSALDLTQDPLFFNDEARRAPLCRLLAGRGLRWSCHARVDRLPAQALRDLRQAGCQGILLGIESGCAKVQRATGKQLDLRLVAPTVKAAVQAGIEARATFIVGFPEEAESSLMATVETVLVARRAGAHSTGVHVLRAYPGSPIHCAHREHLEPAPLLDTAAPSDAEGRRLIADHPSLLSASYLVPGRLSARKVLGTWIALNAYVEVLDILSSFGADLRALLGPLAVDPDTASIGAATYLVGQQLLSASRGLTPLHPTTVSDLVAYHEAVFDVGQAESSEPISPVSLPDLDPHHRPRLAVPWRLVRVRTPVEQLAVGELSPQSGRVLQWALVTKISAPGQVSYYTRRAWSVETFALDELAANVVADLTGQLTVDAISLRAAARMGTPTAQALEQCLELVQELGRAGVVRSTP